VAGAQLAPTTPRWGEPSPPAALHIPALRRVAELAARHRPEHPPDVLVAVMDAPLLPPASARIGDRLLPSAVCEMTPGFVPMLVARVWGYAGPVLCLVGSGAADGSGGGARLPWARPFVLSLQGRGTERSIELQAPGR
jgi:hypothetical protein